MNKIIFSGIQPTGVIHIGNYFGAIKRWAELQDEAKHNLYCVVDLHALTTERDPVTLRKNTLKITAVLLAAGIDPEKSILFVQSSRPEHAELAWILNCICGMGELSRMTQFKEKATTGAEGASVGLFDYPVLMAADILLYDTTHVPVGEDQKQHLELARKLAERFNKIYGQTFPVPEPIIGEATGRIMGLDNPKVKMSKSATSNLNYIAITDGPEEIKQKIKRAVTDSGAEIKFAKDKPAVSNLLTIYSEATGKTIAAAEKEFKGAGYGAFKEKLTTVLIEYLSPIRERYQKFLMDEKKIASILEKGSKRAGEIAEQKIDEVKGKVGVTQQYR